MAKDKLVTLGDELESLMDEIAMKEEELKPLKDKEEAIRAELCKGLLKKGIDYIRITSGLSFGMVDGRVSYKAKKGKESVALKWAMENFPGVLRIGAGDLNKVVQPMLQVPDFIERTQAEPHLAVRTQEN